MLWNRNYFLHGSTSNFLKVTVPFITLDRLLFWFWLYTLYQERTVFGKMKMDPAKRAQTQNAGEVPSLQWFFSQSVELMTDKVWPDLLLAKYFYN